MCSPLQPVSSQTGTLAYKFLRKAKQALRGANEREKLFVSSPGSWYDGKLEEAAKKFEELIAEWPAELVSAKVLEFIYYTLDQQYSGPRSFRAMEGIYETNKNSGFELLVRPRAVRAIRKGGGFGGERDRDR